jgi:uncharacterized protein involved in outer membrane biogenesis
MRKAAFVASIVVLAVALLAAVLPRVASLEGLKPRIIAVLEEKTGRKVGFSGLSLSLFPGIGVKLSGLSVSGDPGYPGENLLSVPEAEIRVALLPLLAGRVEFNRFIVRRAEVVFRKYRDGTHSATQIASRLAKAETPAPPSGEKVAVALKSLSIEEAKVHLFLEGENGRETRWEIDPFTFRLAGIGRRRNDYEIETRISGEFRGEIRLSGSATHRGGAISDPELFDVSAKGKVFGQPVSAEGRMSAPLGLAEVDVTVKFPKIDMEKIPAVFSAPPAPLAEASPEGLATLQVKVSGNLQAMGFEAEADLTRAGWTVGQGLRKFIDMPCTVVAQGHRFPDLFVVSNAEIRFPPLLLIANASLDSSTGVRDWAASAKIGSLADFTKSRGGGFSKWAPAGRLTASGRGRRPTASAKDSWAVGLDLGEVGFQIPEQKLDVRALNGHVELTHAVVDFQPLAGLVNGQSFSLRGTMSLGPAPVGQVSLRMPYLDADKLFPPGEDVKPANRKEAATSPGKAGEARAISARGNLKIDAGKIRGLEFKDLTGSGRYEGGNLFLDSLRALLYGGEATLSGRVRLTPPPLDFRLKVGLKDVEADEILSRRTSLKNFLSGAVSLSADLAGGTGDFARTGAGSGSFRVTGGKIKGIDLLASAAGLSGLRSLLPVAPAVSAGEKSGETSFTDLSADFRVAGGKIRSDTLRIVSEKMSLGGSAAVGFDRTFDFHGRLLLSREMSDRARRATGKFLTDSSGRVEIPLVMSGPVTSPAIAIDSEALARGLAGKAVRSLTERLTGDAADPGAAKEKQAVPDEAGKALEGLFRKILPGKK